MPLLHLGKTLQHGKVFDLCYFFLLNIK